MSEQKKAAVFFDRDGTLIRDVGYPRDPAQVEMIPGVLPVLRWLKQQGVMLVVFSNQSGIGRGIIQPEEAERVKERFIEMFRAEGIEFDGYFCCPHAPEEGCECRKPKPGMLLQAQKQLNLDPSRSYTIGDRLSDVEAGLRAGTKGILFTDHPDNRKMSTKPDFHALSWEDVLHYMKQDMKQGSEEERHR